MRVTYKSKEETKGLNIATTYYPPEANSINHWSESVLSQLKEDIKPIKEMQKELVEMSVAN